MKQLLGEDCMRGIDVPQNRLLASLPPAEFERIKPHLTPVALKVGDALYEAGSTIHYVYFPTTAIASLLYVTSTGSSSDVAVVGNEGLIGVTSVMGGETMPSRAVVQTAGNAYQLSVKVVRQEFMRGGALQRLFLLYTQALLTQMAQTAVCNRHHSLDQQLCRWLLLSLDRLSSNQLVMTQELIANMLGVRREGVTEAAGRLQTAGVIEYRRGHITILKRDALEARACECYSVVRHACDRLLPDPRSAQESRHETLRPALPRPVTQPKIAAKVAVKRPFFDRPLVAPPLAAAVMAPQALAAP
jgi:CRP-like cAMP-binding protein